jgi:hypothetical protein
MVSQDLPVPIEDIADWQPYFVTTILGEIYGLDSSSMTWRLMPIPECSAPVPSEPNSLGGVKSLYR